MPNLEKIRKSIEEGRQPKKPMAAEQKAVETVDVDEVERIVKKMKKKYMDEGVEFEEVGGKLRDLRGMIAEGKSANIDVAGVETLADFKNPLIRQIGGVYLKGRSLFLPITKLMRKFSLAQELGFYLYSANMKFSVAQYLALSAVAGVIAFVLSLLFFGILMFMVRLPLILAPLAAIFVFFFAVIVCLLIPKSNAKKRGDAVSAELPFALRHMATELKAGIGLYKTLQTVATADYGVLSEEFARTINEIEEGIDTKDALRNFALRTQSKALRSALLHIIRAMSTGGNLSNIMGSIAEDVSFELRMKMRDFGEKINFFGVIFIVGAIVLPVFIAIIGGITNAPMGIGGIKLNPWLIAVIYAVIMPMLLAFLIFYLKISQPRV